MSWHANNHQDKYSKPNEQPSDLQYTAVNEALVGKQETTDNSNLGTRTGGVTDNRIYAYYLENITIKYHGNGGYQNNNNNSNPSDETIQQISDLTTVNAQTTYQHVYNLYAAAQASAASNQWRITEGLSGAGATNTVTNANLQTALADNTGAFGSTEFTVYANWQPGNYRQTTDGFGDRSATASNHVTYGFTGKHRFYISGNKRFRYDPVTLYWYEEDYTGQADDEANAGKWIPGPQWMGAGNNGAQYVTYEVTNNNTGTQKVTLHNTSAVWDGANDNTTDIGHVTQVLEYNEPRKTANGGSYQTTAETTTDLGTNVWVPSVNTNNYSAASVEQPQVQQSLRTPHLSLVANDDLKTLDSYFTNTGGATLANQDLNNKVITNANGTNFTLSATGKVTGSVTVTDSITVNGITFVLNNSNTLLEAGVSYVDYGVDVSLINPGRRAGENGDPLTVIDDKFTVTTTQVRTVSVESDQLNGVFTSLTLVTTEGLVVNDRLYLGNGKYYGQITSLNADGKTVVLSAASTGHLVTTTTTTNPQVTGDELSAGTELQVQSNAQNKQLAVNSNLNAGTTTVGVTSSFTPSNGSAVYDMLTGNFVGYLSTTENSSKTSLRFAAGGVLSALTSGQVLQITDGKYDNKHRGEKLVHQIINKTAADIATKYTDAFDSTAVADQIQVADFTSNFRNASYRIKYRVDAATYVDATLQTRVVNTRDTSKPTITVTSPVSVLHSTDTFSLDTLLVDGTTKLSDTVTASDANGLGNVTVTINNTTTQIGSAATHTITYTATDASGNLETTTQTVNIVDAVTEVSIDDNLSSTPAANNFLKQSQHLYVYALLNNSVSTTGTFSAAAASAKPFVNLDIGGVTKKATYDSIRGSLVADSSSLAVSGGTLTGSVWESQNLDNATAAGTSVVTATGGSGSGAQFTIITVDNAGTKSIQSVTVSNVGRDYKAADVLTLTNALFTGGSTTITLAGAAVTNNKLVFKYTIAAGDKDNTGVGIAANSIKQITNMFKTTGETTNLHDNAFNHAAVADDTNFKVNANNPTITSTAKTMTVAAVTTHQGYVADSDDQKGDYINGMTFTDVFNNDTLITNAKVHFTQPGAADYPAVYVEKITGDWLKNFAVGDASWVRVYKYTFYDEAGNSTVQNRTITVLNEIKSVSVNDTVTTGTVTAGTNTILKAGDTLAFDVEFHQQAQISGISASSYPQLTFRLNDTPTTKVAECRDGTAATTFTFKYTIQDGDLSETSISLPAGTLTYLGSALFKDTTGNANVMTNLSYSAVTLATNYPVLASTPNFVNDAGDTVTSYDAKVVTVDAGGNSTYTPTLATDFADVKAKDGHGNDIASANITFKIYPNGSATEVATIDRTTEANYRVEFTVTGPGGNTNTIEKLYIVASDDPAIVNVGTTWGASLTASELTDTQGVNVQVINIENGTLDILIKDASNNGIVSKSKTFTRPHPGSYVVSVAIPRTDLDKFLTDQTYTIVATIGALTETKSFNVDINRPVITLVGDATTFVRVGTAYTDQGATVSDAGLQAIMVTGGDVVDTNLLGSYNVTYNVSDASGNAAVEVVRNVIVRDYIQTVGITPAVSTKAFLITGDNVDITVQFKNSGPVTVNNSSSTYISIQIGKDNNNLDIVRRALLNQTASNLATGKLVFSYTIVSGDVTDEDGISIIGNSINTVITDSGNNSADTTFNFVAHNSQYLVKAVYINEVAPKGSTGYNSGNPWLELYNGTNTAISLANMKLQINGSALNEINLTQTVNSKTFSIVTLPGTFTINTNDIVTLIDADSNVISGTGQIVELNTNESWARTTTGEYSFTSTPTPGAVNIINLPGAGLTGDPYIIPYKGPANKVPNSCDNYRLFEYGDIYVNSSVNEIDITEKMQNYIKNNNISLLYDAKYMINKGYWNDKVFISSEGNTITFDITNKKIYKSNSTDYFKLQTNNTQNDNSHINERMNVLNGGSFTKRYTITWHHSKYGMQSFNVDYFANPQVNNSISFNSALLRQHKSIGLFVKNYRVKYMKVPTIDTTRCNKIHKNIHKAETQLIQKPMSTKELLQMKHQLVASKDFNKLA